MAGLGFELHTAKSDFSSAPNLSCPLWLLMQEPAWLKPKMSGTSAAQFRELSHLAALPSYSYMMRLEVKLRFPSANPQDLDPQPDRKVKISLYYVSEILIPWTAFAFSLRISSCDFFYCCPCERLTWQTKLAKHQAMNTASPRRLLWVCLNS